MTDEYKANEIVRCLCEEGWDAYIAGGAARDILSGEKPLDYDIVTEAPYDVVKKIFHDRKLSLVGESFKVCIVDGIEVATYRKDSYFGLSDKHCEIEEAKNIQEDLGRRDLTINSLAFCPYTGDIVDEYGGIEDLRNHIIKFTGNPEERIYEDPCRILRACRFISKIEGKFDPQTFNALKEYGLLVREHVAPERIKLEILKAMNYRKPSLFFKALYDISVLAFIFPGLEACWGHDGGSFHEESVDTHISIVGNSLPARKPLLRLAGYLHDCGKPSAAVNDGSKLSFIKHDQAGAEIVEKELMDLRFSTKQTMYIKGLVRHHMRSAENLVSPKAIRRMLKAFSDDGVFWKDWLQLQIADRKGNLKKENYSRDQIKEVVLNIRKELKPAARSTVLSVKDLAVNGKDIMEKLEVGPGPEVGLILERLLLKVLDDPDLNDREMLLLLAEKSRT